MIGSKASAGVGLVFVLGACLLAGSPAHAHDGTPLSADASVSPAELEAIEKATLGPLHASEHAVTELLALRAEEGAPLTGGGGRTALYSEGVEVAAAGAPSEVGAWTEAPFEIPTYAIHSVVLPTGKVLFWGRPPLPPGGGTRPNYSEAALWSPWLGTGPGAFTDVTPPVVDVDGPGGQEPGPAPIFCSGQSLLPNGEVLSAGGTFIYAGTFPDDEYTDWGGLPMVFTFDPWSETWTRQPDLDEGRWYPTQTLLSDGRTVVAGGLSDVPPGGVMTNSLEVFNPPSTIGGQGSVDQQPSADRSGIGLYPRMFSFGEDLLVTGPSKALTATLDTSAFSWNESIPSMSRSRIAGNAVRRPGTPGGSDAVITLAGFDRNIGGGPFYAGTETSESIDAAAPAPAWGTDVPLNVGRANSNTVLLPDGSMVVIGGGSGYEIGGGGGYVTYADGRARQVEVYDPDSDSWTLGPAQQEDRTYHSTAVLLPDGRVFSAGDDHNPREADGSFSITDNAEIYSPPYLFKGARPAIDAAPQAVAWGDAFGIESDSPNIDRAVLMSPGATTHAFDMHQRHVELQVLNRIAGQGVDVVAPPSSEVAPPGYYMLFLLDDLGIPSEASWVKLDPSAPDQPTLGSLPAGDFNGDGVADSAIGVPSEDVGGIADAGAVNVIYGSVGGLTAANNAVFNQGDLGGGEAAEAGDRFGAAVAIADFNDDGFADLAVGAPEEDVGSVTNAGAVNVLYGSSGGLNTAGGQSWNQDSTGINDASETGDRFGAAVATGDLDGDGDDELISGAPSETVGTVDAGAVNVIYGSGSGLTSGGNQFWSQDSAGITEAAEAGERFGAAVATGDLNGDSRDDLAVGVPSEPIGSVVAGAVNVIYGSGTGLTTAGNQVWQQNSASIEEVAESGDSFGAAIASGRLNGDSQDDLAIGVPSETVGSTVGGAVNVIYGAAGGLTATGDQLWHQNSTSIKDAAETNDRFGGALAIGDLDGDGDDDLAAGTAGESVGTAAGAGAVNVINGSSSGLTATGNALWSQNSASISETAEASDSFATALAARDVTGDSFADLAIGVPAETIGAIQAGAVNMIYGSLSGLTATGNQLWSQDTAGVLDLAEAGDRFGEALEAGAR